MAVKSMSERARDVAADVAALEAALRAERMNVTALQKRVEKLRKYEKLADHIEVRDRRNPDRLLGYLARAAISPRRTPVAAALQFTVVKDPHLPWFEDFESWSPAYFDTPLRTMQVRMDLTHHDLRACFVTDDPLNLLRYTRGFEVA